MTPDVEPTAVLSAALQVLQKYAAVYAPKQKLQQISGGLSGAVVYKLTTHGADFALRRWPISVTTPQRLSWMAKVLRSVDQTYPGLVPVPVANLMGEVCTSYRDHFWELAPWIGGEELASEVCTPKQVEAACLTLARFHLTATQVSHARPELATSQSLHSRHAMALRLLQSDLGLLRQTLASRGIVSVSAQPHLQTQSDLQARDLQTQVHLQSQQLLPLIEKFLPAVFEQLAVAVTVQVPQLPCIRDIKLDHLRWNGDKVVGLIDFGALQIDTASLDLARLLRSMTGDGAVWQQGLQAYGSLRRLTADEVQLISICDRSNSVLGASNWLIWLYLEQREFLDLALVLQRMNLLRQQLQIWELSSAATKAGLLNL